MPHGRSYMCVFVCVCVCEKGKKTHLGKKKEKFLLFPGKMI